MKSARLRITLSIAAIAVVIALGEFVTHVPAWTPMDLALVSDINAWHFTVVDALALGINTLFNATNQTVVTLIAALIVFAFTRNVRCTVKFLAIIALTRVGTQAIKVLIDRPRPDHAQLSHRLINEYTLSFPSGHTAFAVSLGLAFVATASPGVARRIAVAITVVLGVTVAYSRVYLGVHYVTDVVAAIVYASAAASLIATVWDRFIGTARRNQNDGGLA